MRHILASAILLLIVLSSGVVQAQTTVEVSSAQPEDSRELSFPETFSQGDPRWRAARMGRTTIGQSGCLLTALSMVAQAAGYNYTPLQLLQQFNIKGIITRQGLLKTGLVQMVLPDLRVIDRFNTRPDNAQKVRGYMSDGSFVLLKVDRSPKPGVQQHWVVATGYTSTDIRVIDPNGGKRGTITTLFGTTSSAKEALVIGKG